MLMPQVKLIESLKMGDEGMKERENGGTWELKKVEREKGERKNEEREDGVTRERRERGNGRNVGTRERENGGTGEGGNGGTRE